jgi:N-6 DNA Methylase
MIESSFVAIRSVGGLLPVDTLNAIVEGKGLDGLTPSAYHLLPGETLRGEANRAWQRLLGAWRVFSDSVDALPGGDPAIGVTRERWLLPLFAELGYGRLGTTPAGGLEIDGKAFTISHLWRSTPIHLLGVGVELDKRSSGVAGAAKAAPHAIIQELLNRTDDYLWAFLSNGRTLRVLRDNASLVRQAYLEFDLDAIFEGELFSEFVALFLVCHQSRIESRDETGPRSCWLETWRTASVAAGTRALDHLRNGVVLALRAFGSGFLRHPANNQLRAALASGELAPQDYYRSLLRVAYRLLFVFVAEDRNLLHHPDATPQARDRYLRYFSTARLRRLATRTRSADRHPDLWQAQQLIFDALGNPEGLVALGLPCLGGFLFDPAALGPLKGAQLANADLLAAMRPLALVRDASGLTRTIDYRNLDSEELGSVYESLLQLVPRHNPGTSDFRLEEVAGNERKTTGSYYTPSSLIASLLDTALEPLLDDAIKSAESTEAAETALMRMTICDPACGSGHFLVAAARRIAKRLAAVRTGDPEPAPGALRTALRDVVGRCVYGVDVNDLAAELAKVSLWLEALEPGKPLSFLDAKIKVGNALLGATPALLSAGVPDAAFEQLTGDDKKHTGDLKKRNKRERGSVAQSELFGIHDLHRGTATITARRAEVERYDDTSAGGLAARADAWRRLEASPELQQARFLADAWCAAFVWLKVPDGIPAITDATYRQLEAAPDSAPLHVRTAVAKLAQEYRFFHWHLEFPDVFTVPDDLADADNGGQGWTDGFTAILGNPPWEQVQLDAREFFAASAPGISAQPNMAARDRAIAMLAQHDMTLFAEYQAAKRRMEGVQLLIHETGRFPLTSFGRINTAPLFTELARGIASRNGRVGIIVPTGIATDSFNQYFFRDVVESSSLASLYDFENRQLLFEGVDSRFKFSLLTLAGRAGGETAADFAFFCHDPADLDKPDVRFTLTPDEILLLNPNTGTCPVFRSRRDAEITLRIYSRVPILIRDDDPHGNPWGLSFQLMFMMNTDSHRFHTRTELTDDGWTLDGNAFARDGCRMLPLLEGKMLHHYDHRWATYEGSETRDVTTAEKIVGDFAALPRYWVSQEEVDDRLAGRWEKKWLLGWRDICRSTDERTTIATAFPRYAVGNKVPLMLGDSASRWCLQASLSSLVVDFASRQKVGGTTLNYYLLMQFPILPPSAYLETAPWERGCEVQHWIGDRVRELSFTSWEMIEFAIDLGDDGPPFQWDESRRAVLRAELDAAYFHLYQMSTDDIDYILDTFPIVRRKDEAAFGEYRTKRLIMEIYDAWRRRRRRGPRTKRFSIHPLDMDPVIWRASSHAKVRTTRRVALQSRERASRLVLQGVCVGAWPAAECRGG